MTDLQSIAAMINRHPSGCIATIMENHISVEVPGMGSCGNRYYRIWTTVKVRNLRDATRLVISME